MTTFIDHDVSHLIENESVLKTVDKTHFRNYEENERHDIVENHYRLMRANQTVEFVERMHVKYSFDNPRARMTVREAFDKLETYVDSSDPDVAQSSSSLTNCRRYSCCWVA